MPALGQLIARTALAWTLVLPVAQAAGVTRVDAPEAEQQAHAKVQAGGEAFAVDATQLPLSQRQLGTGPRTDEPTRARAASPTMYSALATQAQAAVNAAFGEGTPPARWADSALGAWLLMDSGKQLISALIVAFLGLAMVQTALSAVFGAFSLIGRTLGALGSGGSSMRGKRSAAGPRTPAARTAGGRVRLGASARRTRKSA